MSDDAKSKQTRLLARIGLVEPADFIVHLPLRYEDNTRLHRIASLRPGHYAQLEGQISDVRVTRRPRRQLTATLNDGSGHIHLRWLHFYPSQIRQLESAHYLRVRGEVRPGYHGLELVHPRISKAATPLSTTLTPVYPTTQGLSQTVLRRAIQEALSTVNLDDTLPDEWVRAHGLMPFAQAINTLHHPPADTCLHQLQDKTHPAWRRIKTDELLAQQLALEAARAARRQQRAFPLDANTDSWQRRFQEHLGFTLTKAQERVISEILADLRHSFPMQRLLQGDVGSGKTVVAATAALQAIVSGYQVALMAPTELLAEQHHTKFSQWFAPLDIELVWLHGRMSASERHSRLAALASGDAQLAIGTQALIQEHVHFARLALVILDEQHRFGVGQRLLLNQKGDAIADDQLCVAHQLSMSATPIPRSLAMTYLADLEVSVIDGLPPGRQAVITKLINSARRSDVIHHVLNEIQNGRQAYWVCPLIQESEALQLQTAQDTYEQLVDALPNVRIGLVHGRLSYEDKHAVMNQFRTGQMDLLVATTVIEVGVDVPNASLMVIEHAERYGLAQLHQLRGRVGRGHTQSVCVLMYQPPISGLAAERLRALYETNDGFTIAQRDLEQRGPGEVLGVRQSGQSLLRFAQLEQDQALIQDVRQMAQSIRTHHPEHAQRHLLRWMRGQEQYLRS